VRGQPVRLLAWQCSEARRDRNDHRRRFVTHPSPRPSPRNKRGEGVNRLADSSDRRYSIETVRQKGPRRRTIWGGEGASSRGAGEVTSSFQITRQRGSTQASGESFTCSSACALDDWQRSCVADEAEISRQSSGAASCSSWKSAGR